MKQINFYIVCALIMGSSWLCPLYAQFAGGTGTADDPWLIETATQLNNVRDYLGQANSNRYFSQRADINLDVAPYNESYGWLPIGYFQEGDHPWDYIIAPFRGTYNGNNHVISGLYINRSYLSRSGLFGFTDSATISNLVLVDANINAKDYVGGLAGYSASSYFNNCSSYGNINGHSDVGGLLGYLLDANLISGCQSAGNVNGTNCVGGLIGLATNYDSIIDCHSLSNITAGLSPGGLMGNLGGTYIRNSFYNYETVLINQEHKFGVGALSNDMFNTWLTNDKVLNIDNYLTREGKEYLINSMNDFKHLIFFGQFNEHSYKLTQDLNMQNDTGFFVPYFSGTFYGNGHKITNIDITMLLSSHYTGIFGYAYQAEICDLRLENVNVHGGGCVGSLVGACANSIIYNC